MWLFSSCFSVQAYYWYELGHKHGHFASVWQRSLYNVDGLKAQPWWTAKETGYTDLVKVESECVCIYMHVQSRFISKGFECVFLDVGEELENDQGRGPGYDGSKHRSVHT